MTLRLMDSAYGIVTNFMLPLSAGACMVNNHTYDPPLRGIIHRQETAILATTPRTINDLPTEVLTRILDYFQDDISSLQTFSLISRPFLFICRRLLFSTLRLNSLGSSFNHQCDKWMSILNHSTEFVASLRLLELGPPVFRLYSLDRKLCSDHWIQIVNQRVPSIHDSRVQTIIRHAHSPQTLILRFEHQAWKDFSLTFHEAVIELIQRETVSSLSLEDVVDFPMVALSGCRHLRDLSLVSSNICESVEPSALFQNAALERSKGYLESLTLFASDQCVETLINVLSSPQSLLCLTKLRRLSINSTGLDGRYAIRKIPLIARYITTLELRVGGQNVAYEICNLCDFPNLRTLLLSISYNRRKRPIRDLAIFLSKSDSSTPSTLEELRILFRHDVPELELEKSSQDTMHMFQHRDWRIIEQKLCRLNLFPALCKLCLGLRPKDVGAFMSEPLKLGLKSSLGKLMPNLYAMIDPIIEVFDDRFEQFTG